MEGYGKEDLPKGLASSSASKIAKRLRELEVFNSTHLVDCLFCKRKHECDDPRNQTTFHNSIKDIDDAIKRIDGYSDLEIRNRLMEEGKRIKETIRESGSAPASYLFIIGRT
jgi:hypothetical protein